jgi:hypothetical protein
LTVDHFREEEILSRPQYAAVAAEFRAGGVVRTATLLAATEEYVASVTAEVVIADALFPYLPSLRAWGHTPEQIAGFLDDLSGTVRPVVLYLDGDPLVMLPRAAARETDPSWLNWYVGRLAAVPGNGVHDLASAAAYLRAERDLTLRLLAGLDLRILPTAAPHDLLRAALTQLVDVLDLDGTECAIR